MTRILNCQALKPFQKFVQSQLSQYHVCFAKTISFWTVIKVWRSCSNVQTTIEITIHSKSVILKKTLNYEGETKYEISSAKILMIV